MNNILNTLIDKACMFFILSGFFILFFLITLIIAVLLFIKCKKAETSTKSSVILFIISGILLICSSFCIYRTFSYVADVSNEYSATIAESKIKYAKLDSNNNIYFEITDFSLVDDNGEEFSNNSLEQYRYTIINFWEPWCIHCKNEMPDLNNIYKDYKDKGINVVGVYTEKENASEVLSEYSLSYPTVYCTLSNYEKIFDQFSTGSIPISFVLDSTGKVININTPESDFSSNIGSSPSKETVELYKCLAFGEKDYTYWSNILDGLLSK